MVIALGMLSVPLSADEGMWPFNQFPREAVNTKQKFDVTPEFLDHLRLSSVRLSGLPGSSGSGGFVSSSGLILTNQHLVAGCIGNSLADGFYAASRAEMRRPGSRGSDEHRGRDGAGEGHAGERQRNSGGKRVGAGAGSA
jgi:hypothetical protein